MDILHEPFCFTRIALFVCVVAVERATMGDRFRRLFFNLSRDAYLTDSYLLL